MSNKITYRQQYTRCGKQRCRKCRDGAGHGPYWYAYWSENGRTISKYIGIHLPEDVEQSKHSEPSTQVQYSPLPPEKAHEPGDGVSRPILRIFLLGQFRIERWVSGSWQEDAPRLWQRRRARALLGCLLSSPARRLGREQIMESLWPELDIETTANRLNGAVHELRQLLEPAIQRPADSSLLRLQRDVLELADRHYIWVDADSFENLLNQVHALTTNEPIELLLEEAAQLYAGDYLLEELYSEWAAPRREALRRRWMGMLLHQADLRATRGALSSAIEPLDRLLVSDPTHETAVRQLMMLLTQLDRRGEALQTYHRLRDVLERDYSSEPLPETRELYEALRQGHIQSPRPRLFAPQASVATYADQMQQATGLIPGDPNVNKAAETAFVPPQQERLALAIQAVTYPTYQSGRHKQGPLIGRARELEVMRELIGAHTRTPQESVNEAQPLQTAAVGYPMRNRSNAQDNQEAAAPHFLLLTGEAGIGKTRLAEELGNEAARQGWFIAWSRSYEQEGTIPYRPWTELLRLLLQSTPETLTLMQAPLYGESKDKQPNNHPLASLAHSQLERLSVLLPELRESLPLSRGSAALPPEQERLHLWEATLGLLSSLSRSRPLMLVLDDLHWADESSLELLAYLARHLREQRILLLGTCRDIEMIPMHGLRTLINDLRREQVVTTLPLQPLTQAQIAEMVSYLPEMLVQSIQTQAGGNPFFAEELARCADLVHIDTNAAIKSPLSTSKDADIQLPETITAVLERRLSRLSSDCQSLLGKMAVFGAPFEFNQLLYMDSGQLQNSNEETVLDLLEEALHAGILTEEGVGNQVTYHFWHPLIEKHLYEHISSARKVHLHRRAANALEMLQRPPGRSIAAAITHHLLRGGSDSGKIASYASLAGDQAYRLAAYSDARYYYRQALLAQAEPTPEHSGHTSSAAIKEAEASQGSASLELAQLRPDTNDRGARLRFTRQLEHISECCMFQGDYQEARLLYTRVLELRQQEARQSQIEASEAAQRSEAQIQAMIWREISLTWLRTGDFTKANDCLEHGQHNLQEAEVALGPAWACMQTQQGNLSILEGNYEKARGYVEQALAILSTTVNEEALFEQAGDQLPTRTERATAGDPLEVGRAHETLGVVAASLGQFSEAREHFDIALGIYKKHDDVTAMAQVYGNLGAISAMTVDHNSARSYMHRALELTERTGDLPNMAFVTGNLGEMARRAGNLCEAESWFRRSIALSEQTQEREHQAWCNSALAETLQAQGRLAEASKLLYAAFKAGRAMQHERTISHTLIALAEMRITQVLSLSQEVLLGPGHDERLPAQQGARQTLRSSRSRRLLQRAQQTLQRASVFEGLEAEQVISCLLIEANIAFLLEDTERSWQLLLQVLKDTSEHEVIHTRGQAQRLLGQILARRNEIEEAASYFEKALQVFERCEMRLEYARTLHAYGASLLLQEQLADDEAFQRGLNYLREARDIFAHSHAAIDLQWVEALLINQSIQKRLLTAKAIP